MMEVSGLAGEDRSTLRVEERDGYIEIITALGTHIGTREYQQDAVFVSDTVCFRRSGPGKAFGILCDGMGGMADGEKASRLAVDTFSEDMTALTDFRDLPEFFRREILKADELIFRERGGGGSGTTLVAVMIVGDQLYWASVGDSRVYLARGEEIVQVTRDHNYWLLLQKDIANGRTTEEEARSHPQREALISYLGSGDVTLMDINKEPFSLRNGDIVLLCSDGLYKSLGDGEIRQTLTEYFGRMREAAQALPRIAFERGGGPKDNTTVALLQYLA